MVGRRPGAGEGTDVGCHPLLGDSPHLPEPGPQLPRCAYVCGGACVPKAPGTEGGCGGPCSCAWLRGALRKQRGSWALLSLRTLPCPQEVLPSLHPCPSRAPRCPCVLLRGACSLSEFPAPQGCRTPPPPFWTHRSSCAPQAASCQLSVCLSLRLRRLQEASFLPPPLRAATHAHPAARRAPAAARGRCLLQGPSGDRLAVSSNLCPGTRPCSWDWMRAGHSQPPRSSAPNPFPGLSLCWAAHAPSACVLGRTQQTPGLLRLQLPLARH